MSTKKSVAGLGQSVIGLLQALSQQKAQEDFQGALQESQTSGGYDYAKLVSRANQMNLPPGVQNPFLPFLQQQAAVKSLTAPRTGIIPLGGKEVNLDTGQTVADNPKPIELPAGFPQITDSQVKANIWNRVYGTALPPSAFDPKLSPRLITRDEKGKPQQYMQFWDASGRMISETPVGEAFRAEPPSATKEKDKYSAFAKLVGRIKTQYSPSYVGGVLSGAGGYKGAAGELMGTNTDQENQFRSNVSSLKNQLLYLRSGAQINEEEYQRLLKEVPDLTNAPSVFESRTKAFTDQLTDILRNKGFSDSEIEQMIGSKQGGSSTPIKIEY